MKVSIKIYLKLTLLITCIDVLSSQIILGGGTVEPKTEKEKQRDALNKDIKEAENRIKYLEDKEKNEEPGDRDESVRRDEKSKAETDYAIAKDRLKQFEDEEKNANTPKTEKDKILDKAKKDVQNARNRVSGLQDENVTTYEGENTNLIEKAEADLKKAEAKLKQLEDEEKNGQNQTNTENDTSREKFAEVIPMGKDPKPKTDVSANTIPNTVIATGRTTGHIADIKLSNTNSNPINFTIPASEIPGDGVYQSYIIPTDTTFIIPGNTILDVPITGFCTNPNLAPRPSGTEFPPMTSWNTSSTLIPTLTKIIEVTTDLQKSGTYHTPFSNQPDIESKVIPQYTFWQYTTPDFNPCIPFKQWHEKFPDQTAIDYGLAQILDAVIITGREAGLPPFVQTYFPPEASVIKDAPPSSNPDIATTIHVTGTGRTTGHIADFTISNPTDQTVVVKIGQGNTNGINPTYIPATGQYQPYIVSSIPDITLSPNQTNTIPLTGFCTDIHVAPVPPGVNMPLPSQWIGLPNDKILSVDPGVVSIPTRTCLPIDESINMLQSIPSIKWYSEKDCPKYPVSSFPVLPGTDHILTYPIDVEKYPAVGVSLLLDAISKITIEYDRQKEKGIVNTPFSGNPEKERESVIQQTFWRYSSSLEGSRYDKNDFQDNTVRQFEKNTGKKFDQQPSAQQQKLVQGVDDFWDTFEAVGTEAKILSRPPEVPKTPVPDDLWNDLPMKSTSNTVSGLEGIQEPTPFLYNLPMKSNSSTQPELIGDKKGKPVAGPAKNNKKTEKKCECGEVTFSLLLWDAVANPPGSEKYGGVNGTSKKKEIKSGGSPALPEENISLKKNLKKGSKQLVEVRNLKVNCPCINQTDEIVKATKELETLKTNAKKKIETAEKKLVPLEKDLIEAEKKLAEEKNGKRPNQNTIKTRQDKVTELQDKITGLRDELETLNKPIQEKQSEIDVLKSKNHEATDCPVYGDKNKSGKLPDVKVNDKDTKVYNDPNAPSEDTRTIVVDVENDNSLEFTIEIKFYCEGTDCKPVECTRKFKVKVDNEK